MCSNTDNVHTVQYIIAYRIQGTTSKFNIDCGQTNIIDTRYNKMEKIEREGEREKVGRKYKSGAKAEAQVERCPLSILMILFYMEEGKIHRI